jgi:hypothetical protein
VVVDGVTVVRLNKGAKPARPINPSNPQYPPFPELPISLSAGATVVAVGEVVVFDGPVV